MSLIKFVWKFLVSDFFGKSIIVTGAAGLLGQQQVRTLLRKGASVLALDLDESKLQEMASNGNDVSGKAGKLYTRACDITSRESVQGVLDSLGESFQIQGLINNAAINPKVEQGLPRKDSLDTLEWSQWELELKVALYGTFVCSQIFGKHMLEHNLPSSIVNLSSDYGHLAPRQSLYDDGSCNPRVKPPTYIAVKHSIVGLTRYFASFWAGTNIRVNALAPGGIANNQDSVFTARLSNEVPLGRMARVDEMDGPVCFLLSEDSSYVNGVELLADGGRAIW